MHVKLRAITLPQTRHEDQDGLVDLKNTPRVKKGEHDLIFSDAPVSCLMFFRALAPDLKLLNGAASS